MRAGLRRRHRTVHCAARNGCHLHGREREHHPDPHPAQGSRRQGRRNRDSRRLHPAGPWAGKCGAVRSGWQSGGHRTSSFRPETTSSGSSAQPATTPRGAARARTSPSMAPPSLSASARTRLHGDEPRDRADARPRQGRDRSGPAAPGDWTVTASGPDDLSGTAPVAATEVSVGVYELSEAPRRVVKTSRPTMSPGERGHAPEPVSTQPTSSRPAREPPPSPSASRMR